MTDRIRTLTVVLEADTRDDDAEDIAKLIRHMRHVDDVKLGPVVGINDHVERASIRRAIVDQLFDLLKT